MIKEILKGIYEAGEYHKRAKSNEKYKQKDISTALAQIKKELVECVPKEKKEIVTDKDAPLSNSDVLTKYLYFGYNQAITETLARIEEKFR